MRERYAFRACGDNGIDDLTKVIEEISKHPAPSATNLFVLSVDAFSITPPVLPLLVQILNQPLSKWNFVYLSRCQFARPERTTLATVDNDDHRYCSPHDMQVFASTLARQMDSLTLIYCPDILEALFNVPQLDMNNLFVAPERLSALECEELGHLVQRSVLLKHLIIATSYLDASHFLGEGLANAYHLQSIAFCGESWSSMTNDQHQHQHQRREDPLADKVIGDGHNGVVGQLIVSPQSQLKRLSLSRMHLEDRHFLAIV